MYDLTTGMFVGQSMSYPEEHPGITETVAGSTPVGFGAVMRDKLNWRAQRVDLITGDVVARAATPVAASVSGLTVTLTGVPVGVEYEISGDALQHGITDDITMAFTFSVPGTYKIEVPCFPELDYAQEFVLT
jgi:hypothetical protein